MNFLQQLIKNHRQVGIVMRNQHTEMLEEILLTSPLNKDGPNFVHESIYLKANLLTSRPKCGTCGINETRFKNIKDGYVTSCPGCKSKVAGREEKFKKTCLEKYGVEVPSRNKEISKRIKATQVANGHWKTEEEKTDYKKYNALVYRATYSQPIHLLENFEKRAKAGVPGAYHLDHNFSIFDGFNQSISPDIIGHIENLKMIPAEMNREKWSKSSISLDDLLSRIKRTSPLD